MEIDDVDDMDDDVVIIDDTPPNSPTGNKDEDRGKTMPRKLTMTADRIRMRLLPKPLNKERILPNDSNLDSTMQPLKLVEKSSLLLKNNMYSTAHSLIPNTTGHVLRYNSDSAKEYLIANETKSVLKNINTNLSITPLVPNKSRSILKSNNSNLVKQSLPRNHSQSILKLKYCNSVTNSLISKETPTIFQNNKNSYSMESVEPSLPLNLAINNQYNVNSTKNMPIRSTAVPQIGQSNFFYNHAQPYNGSIYSVNQMQTPTFLSKTKSIKPKRTISEEKQITHTEYVTPQFDLLSCLGDTGELDEKKLQENDKRTEAEFINVNSMMPENAPAAWYNYNLCKINHKVPHKTVQTLKTDSVYKKLPKLVQIPKPAHVLKPVLTSTIVNKNVQPNVNKVISSKNTTLPKIPLNAINTNTSLNLKHSKVVCPPKENKVMEGDADVIFVQEYKNSTVQQMKSEAPVTISAPILPVDPTLHSNQNLIVGKSRNGKKEPKNKKQKNAKRRKQLKYSDDFEDDDDSEDENYQPKGIPKHKNRNNYGNSDSNQCQFGATYNPPRMLTRSQFRNWPTDGMNEQPEYEPETGIILPFGARMRDMVKKYKQNPITAENQRFSELCHEVLHRAFSFVETVKSIDININDENMKQEEEKEIFLNLLELQRMDSRNQKVCTIVKETMKNVNKDNVKIPENNYELDELVINSFYLYCVSNNIYQHKAYKYLENLGMNDIGQLSDIMRGLPDSK